MDSGRADVVGGDLNDQSVPGTVASSRSTPAIVLLSTVLALAAGLLMCGIWLGFMALVFRGDGEVDGVGVAAFLALGLGAALLVTLVIYVATGVTLIRRHRPEGTRTGPTILLLALPLLAVVAVVVVNG
ncbi:hypothetical protein [Ilumatobacter sp.]|uniref:hypothetical protein n=1 Tax=Ilumatobacter sp. TaxID=1967498 RepID=UPI003AF7848D